MKLTDFAIDGAGSEAGIGLESLHRRLNVVVADTATRRRIRSLWSRCLTDPAQQHLPFVQAGFAPVLGWMRAQINHRPVRIVAGHAGRRIDDLLNRDWTGEAALLPGAGQSLATPSLAGDQREVLDRLLVVDADPAAASNSPAALVAAAQTWRQRLDGSASAGMPWRTEAEYRAWQLEATARRQRLQELQKELVEGEGQLRSIQARLREHELAGESRRQQELLAATARHELQALQDALVRQEQRRVALEAEIARLERELASPPLAVPADSRETARQIRLAGLLERIDEIDAALELNQKLLGDVQAERLRLRDEAEGRTTLPIDSEEHPYHRTAELVSHLAAITAETAAALAGTQGADALPANHCTRLEAGLRSLCAELEQQYRHVRHRAAIAELKQLRLCHESLTAAAGQLTARRAAIHDEARELNPGLVASIQPRESEFFRWLRADGVPAAIGRLTGQSWPAMATTGVDRSGLRQKLDAALQQRTLAELEVQRINEAISGLRNRLPLASAGIAVNEEPWLRQQEQVLSARLASARADLARLQLTVDEESRRPAWKPDPALQLAGQWLEQLSGGAWRELRWGDATATWQLADAAGNWKAMEELPPAARRDARICLALVAQRQCQLRGTPLPMLAELAGENLAEAWLTRLTSLLEQQGLDDHQLLVLADRWPVLSNGTGTERNDLLRVYDLLRTGSADTTARIVAWQKSAQPAMSPPSVVSESLPPVFSLPPPVETPVRPLAGRFNSSLASFQPAPAPSAGLPLVETAISEETLLQNVNLCPPDLLRLFSAIRVLTIADLLELDPADPPVALIHASMSAEDLDRVQAAAWLMVCVPGLYTDDARLLVDCGVTEPEQLETTQADQLLARLQRQAGLTGPPGRAGFEGRYTKDRIQRWYRGLAATRSSWRQPSGYSRRMKRKPLQRTELPDYSAQGEGGGGWFAQPRPGAWRAGEPYFDEQGRSRPGIWREPEDSGVADEPEQDLPAWRDRATPASRPSFFADRAAPETGPASRSPAADEGRTGNVWPPKEEARSASASGSQAGSRGASVRPLRELADFDRNGIGLRRNRNGVVERNGHERADEPAVSAVPATAPLRFFLNLDDAVEAAPSIGPKTASKFEQIGVRNIRDFLRTTAESMAERINFKRITADVIRQWQAQSRMVFRIPNLRDHDAQLLVGVGIDEPEKLESMTPRQVLDLVGPYADSKEGLKIIRSGKRPDLAEVTDWIQWARQMRSLSAA